MLTEIYISLQTSQVLRVHFTSTGRVRFSTTQPARKTMLYMECASHKKSLSRPSNTTHATTVAIFEEKVSSNDNHCLKTCINSQSWFQKNGTLHCTLMPTSVQRTAVWPVFRVPRLSAPFETQDAWSPAGELFGTEDTSEEKFLTKPNPSCLFSNSENSLIALQLLDLLIIISPTWIGSN